MRRASTWTRSTSEGGGSCRLFRSLAMIKTCTCCKTEYYAKWRNEPVTLCPACRAAAVLCDQCGAQLRAPSDPAQLPLFPALVVRAPSRLETPTVEERYWSLRAKASQATRRKYPYH